MYPYLFWFVENPKEFEQTAYIKYKIWANAVTGKSSLSELFQKVGGWCEPIARKNEAPPWAAAWRLYGWVGADGRLR